ARLGRELIGREVPGGGGEHQAGGFLGDGHLGALRRVGNRRIDGRSGDHDLVVLAGEAVGLEDEVRRALGNARDRDGGGLATAELVHFREVGGERVEHLGGGSRALPV